MVRTAHDTLRTAEMTFNMDTGEASMRDFARSVEAEFPKVPAHLQGASPWPCRAGWCVASCPAKRGELPNPGLPVPKCAGDAVGRPGTDLHGRNGRTVHSSRVGAAAPACATVCSTRGWSGASSRERVVRAGRPTRYAYLADTDIEACSRTGTLVVQGIVKLDLLQQGERAVVGKVAHGPHVFGGEAFFVPAHEDPSQCQGGPQPP